MLTISAPQFDIEGSVLIHGADPAGLHSFSRRVSRIATLDGRAEINDFGYSPSDRTLNITWRPRTRNEIDQVRRMAQIYGRLIISFRDGCFLAAPENFSEEQDSATLTALIETRLDA